MGPRLRSGIKCNFEERSLASLTGLFIEFVGDEFIKKLKRELIIFLQVCVMCRSIFFFFNVKFDFKGILRYGNIYIDTLESIIVVIQRLGKIK